MSIPRPTLASLLAVAALALPACGGQTGEVAPEACDGPITWLALNDANSTGFSAAEVLGTIPASSTADFEWGNGDQTSITLSVVHDADILNEGKIAHVEASGSRCAARLEIPVAIALATADGLLDETIVEYMRAEAPDTASVQADLYATGLAGSLVVESLVPAESWDPNTARLFFALQVGDDARGTIELSTHREGGEASQIVVGSW